MNIWLSLFLISVVGFVAYNIGFDQGTESAPESVAFELQKIEMERERAAHSDQIAFIQRRLHDVNESLNICEFQAAPFEQQSIDFLCEDYAVNYAQDNCLVYHDDNREYDDSRSEWD